MNMPDGSSWEPDNGFSNSNHNNFGGGGGGSFQPIYGGGGISSSGSFGKLYWIFKPSKQRNGFHWEKGDFQLNFTPSEIVGWEWISNPDGTESGFPELADISWIHRPIDEIYGSVDAGLGADVSRGAIPEYLRRCGMCHNPEGQYWDHLAGWREAFWMNVIGIMGAADIGLMFATLPAKASGTTTLYHYTSRAGYKAIMESGELLPSVGLKNARYGVGQYLTDIAPGQFTMGQTSRRLYGVPWNRTYLTHYLEIEVGGLNLIKNAPYNYLIPNSSSLNLGRRIVGGGLTGY